MTTKAIVSSDDLLRWINPWPIWLPRKSRKKKWELRVESLAQAGRYCYMGKDPSGKHCTVAVIAKRLRRADNLKLPDPLGGRGYYVSMLARDYIPTLSSLTIEKVSKEADEDKVRRGPARSLPD